MTEMTERQLDARRTRLRSDVRLAARALPTHYPLGTFIAVNPLGGLQSMPFEQAIRRASDLYGTRGTFDEHTFRSLHARGRITDSDIERALLRRFPMLVKEPQVELSGRRITAVELLRADLLHGEPVSNPLRRYGIRAEQIASDAVDTVDAQAAKWSAAFLGESAWPMPGRHLGFYSAWRMLAHNDRTLSPAVRSELRACVDRPDDALHEALRALDVADEDRVSYLQAHLTRQPGWAAHVQWCSDRETGIDLLQYLAMRVTYEAALLKHDPRRTTQVLRRSPEPTARDRVARLVEVWALHEPSRSEAIVAARILAAMPPQARPMIWQNAYEAHYQDELLSRLSIDPRSPASQAHTQLVACIDTRSEGLRRHLEARGGYETYGFAGFFAVAIRFTNMLGGAPVDSCPVLISPSHHVVEEPDTSSGIAARRTVAGAVRVAGAETAFHAAKESLTGPFTLAEAAGWIAGPLAVTKTLAPSLAGRIRRRLRSVMAPPVSTTVDVEAMQLADRALFAIVTLKTIGLTEHFGRLVVLCGHESRTENNPYQASLDCGACGGQSGSPNARTAALILNQPAVRDELAQSGIRIPEHTYVVAALHDTTTDRVTVLDPHLVPSSHRADISRLETDLAAAGRSLAAERTGTLPGAGKRKSPNAAAAHVARRSVDWAQVYPEWGLAGNAAFIIGPRAMTRTIDLQRRAFLHSYDGEADFDGTALETILTAPLVVAQWINSQYYFSTVAPGVFGAGTKTIHNVVGNVGVLAGHSGDLRLGLPWQSVGHGHRHVHEPQRLLAIIEAPLTRVDAVISRNPILQQIIGNDWITVAARARPGEPWQRWTHTAWRPWNGTPIDETTHTEEMMS